MPTMGAPMIAFSCPRNRRRRLFLDREGQEKMQNWSPTRVDRIRKHVRDALVAARFIASERGEE